jgi:hypothetical protein
VRGTKLHAEAASLAALDDDRNTSFCHAIPQPGATITPSVRQRRMRLCVERIECGVMGVTEGGEVKHELSGPHCSGKRLQISHLEASGLKRHVVVYKPGTKSGVNAITSIRDSKHQLCLRQFLLPPCVRSVCLGGLNPLHSEFCRELGPHSADSQEPLGDSRPQALFICRPAIPARG